MDKGCDILSFAILSKGFQISACGFVVIDICALLSLMLSIKLIMLILLWGCGNGLDIAINNEWVCYTPGFLSE